MAWSQQKKTLYQPHHPRLVYLRWNCLWSCHIFGKGHKCSQLLGLTAVFWKALCIDISQPSVDRCTFGKMFNLSLIWQFHFFLYIFISHCRLFSSSSYSFFFFYYFPADTVQWWRLPMNGDCVDIRWTLNRKLRKQGKQTEPNILKL